MQEWVLLTKKILMMFGFLHFSNSVKFIKSLSRRDQQISNFPLKSLISGLQIPEWTNMCINIKILPYPGLIGAVCLLNLVIEFWFLNFFTCLFYEGTFEKNSYKNMCKSEIQLSSIKVAFETCDLGLNDFFICPCTFIEACTFILEPRVVSTDVSHL